MKKTITTLTAVLLSLTLLCAAPQAFAADSLHSVIRERLENLKTLCETVRAEDFRMDGSSLAAFEEAEALLNSSPTTDEAAVDAIHTAQSLLRTVEVSSAYGLSESLENLYSFDDALFRERFAYPYQYEHEHERDDDRAAYEELYYRFANGKLDWVLTHTVDSNPQPIECYMLLGDRVLRDQCGDLPFAFGYLVYDAATERFLPLKSAYEICKRGGFAQLPEAMALCLVGEPLGDIDGDRRLTIKDATALQRCLAELEAFPQRDIVSGFDYLSDDVGNRPMYLSDRNRNGARDIGDVTAIQRTLAELDIP